jgi:hypothetical protein
MTHSTVYTRTVVSKFSETSAPGTLEVIEFGQRDRLKRGAVTALKCLGVTLVCLCIPGAHFVLVPLGLLLTPVIVFIVARIPTKILSSKVSCPKCHALLAVLSTKERYPLYENCSACHREITITPA